MTEAPLLTLVLAPAPWTRPALRRTLRSLQAQTDPRWELLISGGGGPQLDVASVPELGDARVRVLSVDPSASDLGDAIGHAAGDHVAVIDIGGQLEPSAVEQVAEAVAEAPGSIDVVYTDETVLGGAPADSGAFFKPPWSPERLRGHSYAGRLCALRVAAVEEAGGVREGLAGAVEHDLLLRVGELGGAVVRVPETLYRGPAPEPVTDETWDAHVLAVREHLTRIAVDGTVERGWHPGTTRVVRDVRPETRVCVVVATQGDRGLVWGESRVYVVEAVRSVLARSGLLDPSVVVVHTEETPPEVLRDLAEVGGDRVRLRPHVGVFDIPVMLNQGALLGRGDVLVLMEDRTEIDSDDFLAHLVAPLLGDEGIGLTGPRVLAANGTHLAAGLALYELRADPMFRGRMDEDPIRAGVLAVSRECSALPPWCLALTRRTFEEVGGLNERLKTLFHVDLALKVGHLALSRVWLGHVRLRHFPPVEPDLVKEGEHPLLGHRWPINQLDEYMPHFGKWRIRRRAERESAEGETGGTGGTTRAKRDRAQDSEADDTADDTAGDTTDDTTDDTTGGTADDGADDGVDDQD